LDTKITGGIELIFEKVWRTNSNTLTQNWICIEYSTTLVLTINSDAEGISTIWTKFNALS